MQFVPCVILIIGIPFLPESPRWLAMKDRNEEAIEVLSQIQAQGDRNKPRLWLCLPLGILVELTNYMSYIQTMRMVK